MNGSAIFSAIAFARNSLWGNGVIFWRNAVGKSPKKARASAQSNLGLLYGELGRFEDEIKEYQTALTYKYNSPEVHKNLGISYRQLGRYDEAIRELGIALTLNPNDGDALRNLKATKALLGNR